MLQSLDDQIVFAPRWPASPFPGLRPFRITATEDESLIFYGRNRAKDEILARLTPATWSLLLARRDAANLRS